MQGGLLRWQWRHSWGQAHSVAPAAGQPPVVAAMVDMEETLVSFENGQDVKPLHTQSRTHHRSCNPALSRLQAAAVQSCRTVAMTEEATQTGRQPVLPSETASVFAANKGSTLGRDDIEPNSQAHLAQLLLAALAMVLVAPPEVTTGTDCTAASPRAFCARCAPPAGQVLRGLAAQAPVLVPTLSGLFIGPACHRVARCRRQVRFLRPQTDLGGTNGRYRPWHLCATAFWCGS